MRNVVHTIKQEMAVYCWWMRADWERVVALIILCEIKTFIWYNLKSNPTFTLPNFDVCDDADTALADIALNILCLLMKDQWSWLCTENIQKTIRLLFGTFIERWVQVWQLDSSEFLFRFQIQFSLHFRDVSFIIYPVCM